MSLINVPPNLEVSDHGIVMASPLLVLKGLAVQCLEQRMWAPSPNWDIPHLKIVAAASL